MRLTQVFVAGFALALALCSFDAQAQSRRAVRAVAPPPQKCQLRALDGSCANPFLVQVARNRAAVLATVRVSYFGSPMGSIGGRYIPFERFFKDNDTLFGLPTAFCNTCITYRSK